MKRGYAVLLLAVLVGNFYAATYDFRPTTDTRLNNLQSRALALHGDIDLTRYAEDYHLDNFAMALPRHGDLRSGYGVGISVIALPIYAVLGRFTTSGAVLEGTTSILFATAAVAGLYFVLLKLYGTTSALLGALAFAFGTTLWPVGTTAFWQQAPVLALQSVGLIGLFSHARWSPALAGAALGVAVWIRPAAAFVFVAGAVVYFARKDRRALVAYLASGALPVIGLLVQNQVMWGSLLRGAYRFSPDYGFGNDLGQSLPGFFIGPWRGLFLYSPFLVFSVVSVGIALRDRTQHHKTILILQLGAVATLSFYVWWTFWWGGQSQYGYRLPLDVVPILVLGAVHGSLHALRFRAVTLALVVISILIMVAGSITNDLGWDYYELPEHWTATPLAQATYAALHAPLDTAARIIGIALIAVIMHVVTRRLPAEGPAHG